MDSMLIVPPDEEARVPRWGLGRFLRLLTGVQEEVLSKVPGDRARYAAMGGVVLGTALMAAVSMGVALFCVFDGFNPTILLVVPVWGLFIVSLDRWLMSTTVAGQVFKKLVPRLLLAIALGVIIAEPLMLGVFNSAIEERIAADRSKEVTTTESDLRVCNPVPGTPEAASGASAAARCAELRLSLDGTSPEALRVDLDSKTANADAFRKALKADQAKYAGLNDLARRECNGSPGPGLTNRVGEGPNCKRLRKEADQFYTDSRIKARENELAAMDGAVSQATTDLGTGLTRYSGLVDAAIEEKVAEVKARQKSVGLLERLRTLGDLVDEDGYVAAAEWALRIFFIIVDSLPVLLKVLSGTTAYDRMLLNRTTLQEQMEQMNDKTEARRRAEREDLRRHAISSQHRDERRRFDLEVQKRTAAVDEQRGRLIAAKEKQLLEEVLRSPFEVADTVEIQLGGPRHGLPRQMPRTMREEEA